MIRVPESRAGRALIAALSGAGLGLAFPAPGWWPLLVPSLALLAWLLTRGRARSAFVEGWIAGAVFQGLGLRWFAAAILDHTEMGALVAWSAVSLAALILGSLYALLCAIVARVASRYGPAAALAAFPLAWVALERLREAVPVPFPWSILAAATARHAFATDVARLAGAAGLSLLIAALAASLAGLAMDRRRGAAALAAVSVFCLAVVGAGASMRGACSGAEPVRVAVLQGALPMDSAPRDELDTYAALTREAAAEGARLAVWPESAVPFRVDADESWRGILAGLAAAADLDIVLGSVTSDDEERIYNSAALVRENEGLTSVSSKRVLVPFGEYVPFRAVLGSLPIIVDAPRDFSAGEGVTLHDARDASIGALVCYEAVFPGLGCDFADHGATMLVTMTNDTWFGRTGGPEQHLLHSVLRAAETRRPLLRAAHSGISAIADADGRIVGEIPLGTRGVLVAGVRPCAGPAPACVAGRAVSLGCVIVAAVLGLAACLPARSARGRKESSLHA